MEVKRYCTRDGRKVGLLKDSRILSREFSEMRKCKSIFRTGIFDILLDSLDLILDPCS